MQTLKFKPKTNLGPLWDTMTTTDKMPINKHKSKEQVVTFFININKYNQYSHFITCNIDHWLITQKTIKQPQAKLKTQTANWFLTRILVHRTTVACLCLHLQHYVNSRCRMDFCVSRAHEEKRMDFCCLIRVHCNTMSIADAEWIFAFLGLMRKREWIFIVWSVLCSNLE